MDKLVQDICCKLQIDPTVTLKKAIRGLPGFNSGDLIEALIYNETVDQAAEYLQYSKNPVKEAIRAILHKPFDKEKSYFNSGVHISWRKALLSKIGLKYCNTCKCIKETTLFQYDSEKGTSSNCKSCRINKTKQEKQHIVQRTPIWADLKEIRKFYNNCPTGYHVDHIIPLRGKTVSGLHIISNLQYLTALDNIRKSNSYNE